MNNTSILNLELNFKLINNKYYITLANKVLKTKQGNDIYCHSLMVLKAVQDDYKAYKFKSKWINLVSSYVDFANKQDDIANAKQQIKEYFKTDLLLYLDDSNSEFFAYQQKEYKTLVNKLLKLINTEDKLSPVSSLAPVEVSDNIQQGLNEIIESLSLEELFISIFLTKISTSSILTLLYLKGEINSQEFYNVAFHAELLKLDKAKDDEEAKRLEIIKQELAILDYFYMDGLVL